MRYILAMVCGLLGAGLAARFVAIPFAPWASAQFSYDSPMGAENVEQWAFIGVLICGLGAGWALGWMIGFPFGRRRRVL